MKTYVRRGDLLRFVFLYIVIKIWTLSNRKSHNILLYKTIQAILRFFLPLVRRRPTPPIILTLLYGSERHLYDNEIAFPSRLRNCKN